MFEARVNLYQPPKPTLRSPNSRQGELIIEISQNLLIATSSWASQKQIDGSLYHSTMIPQGLDYWTVRHLLSWIKDVAEKMGTDDPGQWDETATTKNGEVWTSKLKMAGRPDALGVWLDTYLASTTLGISGGPLFQMRGFSVEKIEGFLDDVAFVLEAEEVMRIWDVFYTLPALNTVGEGEERILRKTLDRIAKTSEGNTDMERHYHWSFHRGCKPDLLETYLGFMIEGATFPLPPKLRDEETVALEALEERSGTIPKLIVEGESSKGLNWRNTELRRDMLDENRLHVYWRPTPRVAMFPDDVKKEDAPGVEDVPELVEEPDAICNDEVEEDWEGDHEED